MMKPAPDWQYHEPSHPGADFDSLAEIYDKNMQKLRDIKLEISEVLNFLELQPDQTALDLGAGTGEFALAAAGHCSKVYAVDLSAGMLRYAGKKASAQKVNNVEFMQGGFLTYEHNGPPLDAVVTQIALHHLPDFWKQVALMRISGMMKDGGKFFLRDMVYSFNLSEHKMFFDGYLSRVSAVAGHEFSKSIVAHFRNEYSTLGWIMEGLIERAGFEIERAEYTDGFIGAYFCRKV